MTTHEAKRIIGRALQERKLAHSKLTAKTVSFTDLLRADCIFVTIHGWTPNPVFSELEAIAKSNGFCIDAINAPTAPVQEAITPS
jgi:hypothetical protein